MREMRQSTRRSARQSARERVRRKVRKLITIRVSSIVKVPLLNSLVTKAKLIQVTSTAIKHAKKSFISRLGGFSLHISLGFEGWLWIGWVVDFGWFECFLIFVVVGVRNNLRSTLLTLFLISFKSNT
jgi:hypothetical protein